MSAELTPRELERIYNERTQAADAVEQLMQHIEHLGEVIAERDEQISQLIDERDEAREELADALAADPV